jgi:hypothetical protein
MNKQKVKMSIGVVCVFLFLIAAAFNVTADVQREEDLLGQKLEPVELKGWELTLPYEEQEKLLSAKASGSPYMVLYKYWYSYDPDDWPPGKVVVKPRDLNDLSNFPGETGSYIGDHLHCVDLYNGAQVQIFEHDNFRGNSVTFVNPGRNELGSFSSKASSIKWLTNENPGPYVILYEHDSYRGRIVRINFPIDMNCLKKTLYGNMNDRVSSIRLFNGAAIAVFKHSNWAGYSKIITTDVADLKRDPDSSYHPLADTISSMTWDHASMGL